MFSNLRGQIINLWKNFIPKFITTTEILSVEYKMTLFASEKWKYSRQHFTFAAKCMFLQMRSVCFSNYRK